MMTRLKTMDVLVVGLTAMGIETAKNLALSGPRSLTVHDPTVATTADLGLNFFLDAKAVEAKARRDVVSCIQLAQLNPRVKCRTL
jgi:molybdopterin/thiamine biosynthesis adenylyltransferase